MEKKRGWADVSRSIRHLSGSVFHPPGPLFAVLEGRHAELLPENIAEVFRMDELEVCRDFPDAQTTLLQETAGLLQPELEHIPGRRHRHIFLPVPVEGAARKAVFPPSGSR